MDWSADPPSRRSPRLKGYDYTEDGAYFVTICTAGKRNLFGTIVDGRMISSPLGDIVRECWRQIPFHTSGIRVGVFQAMPDHVHGIIEILPHSPRKPPWGPGTPASEPCRDVSCPPAPGVRAGNLPTDSPGGVGANDMRFSRISPRASSLGAVVRSFKSAVTKAAHEARACGSGPVWQERYYDRVIRSPRERFLFERYIELNPLLWHMNRNLPLTDVTDLPSLHRRLRDEFGLSEYEIPWVLRAGGPGNRSAEE